MRMGGGGGNAMRSLGGMGSSSMRGLGGMGGSGLSLGRSGSPGGGSIRMPSGNLGGLGGLNLSGGGGAGRSMPRINTSPSLGSPNLGNLSRQATTNLRPSTGNLNSALQGLQSRINSGGRGPKGQGLGNLNSGNLNAGNLAGNLSGRIGQANNSANNARIGGDGPSLRLPLAGRVSPSDLGNFLGVRGSPGNMNLGNANLGNLGRGGGGLGGAGRNNAANSLGNLAGINNLNRGSRGPGANNINNISASQVSLIRNNVNTAFRNQNNINVNNINSRVNNFNNFNNFNNNHWNNWGGNIRNSCNFNRFNGCFNNRFWATNYCYFPYRRSYYWWGNQPWNYWYGCPTWSSFQTWFPSYGWNSPFYYNYGAGGNVLYDGGYVYVNGAQVATAADYAASAAALATVPTPANPDAATQWLPLGTFALSAGEADKDPTRVMQLAVDKDGNISGTMVNKATNQTYPVQGRVDKETQRVAFSIGGSQDVVLETGIYNLTQQQTPLLAHGDGREETYLLYRLDPPKTEATTPAAPAPGLNLIP